MPQIRTFCRFRAKRSIKHGFASMAELFSNVFIVEVSTCFVAFSFWTICDNFIKAANPLFYVVWFSKTVTHSSDSFWNGSCSFEVLHSVHWFTYGAVISSIITQNIQQADYITMRKFIEYWWQYLERNMLDSCFFEQVSLRVFATKIWAEWRQLCWRFTERCREHMLFL